MLKRNPRSPTADITAESWSVAFNVVVVFVVGSRIRASPLIDVIVNTPPTRGGVGSWALTGTKTAAPDRTRTVAMSTARVLLFVSVCIFVTLNADGWRDAFNGCE